MSSRNKVIWREGFVLLPQHFQQAERYLEGYTEARTAPLRPYPWGFVGLKYALDAATGRKLTLEHARGIFPDGTPFDMGAGGQDELPPPVVLEPAHAGQVIYLALLERSADSVEVSTGEERQLARATPRKHPARDTTVASGESEVIEVAALSPQLIIAASPPANFTSIAVARLGQITATGRAELDPGFLPTVVDIHGAPPLKRSAEELLSMINQRASALARTAVPIVRASTADLSDFITLLTLHRTAPILEHLTRTARVHPERLYCLMLTLAWELATISRGERRPIDLGPYNHEDLRVCFDPLMDALRILLAGGPSAVVPIEIVKRAENWYVAQVSPDIIDSARLILAVWAEIPDKTTLAQLFPSLCKLAAPGDMARVAGGHDAGIRLKNMQGIPPLVPLFEHWAYFELDRTSEGALWTNVRAAQTLQWRIFEPSRQLPGLKMSLWALRA